MERRTIFRIRSAVAHWCGMHLSALDSIATANHGVVTRESSGLSRSSWYRAIASGQIEQLFPGVARLHGSARTREQHIAAAVLATGPASLASHRSAAHLWGIPRPLEDPVDVTIVGTRRRFVGLDDVVIHRPRDLQRLRPQRPANIPCTNILRTVLDLGAVDPLAVPDAVGHVITNGLAAWEALETVVSSTPNTAAPASSRCARRSPTGRSTASRPTRFSSRRCAGSSIDIGFLPSSSIR